mmetsp:Transcript_779/g.1806  ORF Transcript_779/g.1806 Transcript_779/m.1806 type:complete len:230 (+) Transcript_779:247-936(+)
MVTVKEIVKSQGCSVAMLGLLGVSVMLSVALSLAYTQGEPDFRSPVLYTSIETDAVSVESDVVPCSTDELGACGTVLEYGTANSSLGVTVSISDDEALSDVSYAEVRLCFGKSFTTGRPWRSPSDVIGKDKQCSIKACGNVTFEGSEGKCVYNVADNLGESVYYFRALLVKGTGDEPQYVAAAQNTDGLFQIDAYQGRTTGIIIAVAVMSAISWVVLIGGFTLEKFKRK